MTILKTLSITLLLAGSMVGSAAFAANHPVVSSYTNEIPVKTIFIKHPAADDATKYFSSSTVVNFEVYKIGSKADINAMMASFQKDAAVESINLGVTTGDYQAFTLILKSAQSKQWFITEFKKAGLNTIKINRNPIVEVEKL